MSHVVYWIHHADHTDMLNQGYIGVSNNAERRWKYHRGSATNAHLKSAVKKYGWDNLIKQVVLIADKDYCFTVEAKLRADKDTGWNIAPGGGNPPGYKMCGDDHPARWPQNIGRYNGGGNPMAHKITVNGVIYACIKEFANATGLNYSTARYRARTNPEKWGYEVTK